MKKYVTQFNKNGVTYISDIIIYATDWECAEIYLQVFFPNLSIHGEFVCKIKF